MNTIRTVILATLVAVAVAAASGVLGGSASVTQGPHWAGIGSPRTLGAPQRPNALPGPLPRLPRTLVPAPGLRPQALALRAEPARLPDAANLAALEPATCPDDALAWGFP